MQAIGQAAEFIQVFLAGPLIILLTVAFLYTILGWRCILPFVSVYWFLMLTFLSALVGFAVLLVQMPFPALFTRWLQGAAQEMAKKSDDRVEMVTESKCFWWPRHFFRLCLGY